MALWTGDYYHIHELRSWAIVSHLIIHAMNVKFLMKIDEHKLKNGMGIDNNHLNMRFPLKKLRWTMIKWTPLIVDLSRSCVMSQSDKFIKTIPVKSFHVKCRNSIRDESLFFVHLKEINLQFSASILLIFFLEWNLILCGKRRKRLLGFKELSGFPHVLVNAD